MIGEFMPHLSLALIIQVQLRVIQTESSWNLGHRHGEDLETVIHLDNIVGVEPHVNVVVQTLVADKR